MDEPAVIVIECNKPGLTCCDHRLVSRIPSDNVMRCKIFCMKWRENHSKDGIIRGCEE